MHKGSKDALSDAFYIGFEKANTGLKNASYNFVEDALTAMATKISLDDKFDRNLERRTPAYSS